MKNFKKDRGFSLIELLIVVVVIGIVAAIAVPNLMSARRAANEGSTVGALRTIHSAEAMYYATKGNYNYGTAAQLYNAHMIDQTVAAAHNVNVGGNPATNTAKAGYRFRIQVTSNDPTTGSQSTFVVSGRPATTAGVTQTGVKRYCMTDVGVIKSDTASLGTHFNYNRCNQASAFENL
ncbi:MAG: prepilin-type N-terminal cleavage/methylation domain-containing protein [Pyrinomonadaceae bacterium]